MENNQKRNYRVVGAPVVKKDAKALVTGKPVYTDDLALKDCLIVKVLRSPYAHALITDCLLYTSPSPRDGATSRMPSSA